MVTFAITTNRPQTWESLQLYCGEILYDCGFEIEIEKKLETVRGNVEVDVYAEKQSAYQSKIILECKYWDTPIPKTIVHAFRMVVNDYGATYGYIISKNGFQKGAYEATTNSNISLLSWDEFLERFKIEWLHCVIERNYKLGRELLFAWQKLCSCKIDLDGLNAERESDFLFLTFKEHYLDLATHEISLPEIDTRILHYSKVLPNKVESYIDFFGGIYEQCNKMLIKWEAILDNNEAS